MAAWFDPDTLLKLFDQSVERWHSAPIVHDERSPALHRANILHGFNFQLWHEEDQARAEGVDDTVIGQVKRRIDPLNQERNNAMEALDEWVLQALGEESVRAAPDAPQHSESVGSIVDRLSILSLKCYHMREETLRPEATPEHRQRCQAKLAILQEQRADLAAALRGLLDDLRQGRKRFKVYRQMKMYNDPFLNPVLYGAGNSPSR